jgi:hypothetical protein
MLGVGTDRHAATRCLKHPAATDPRTTMRYDRALENLDRLDHCSPHRSCPGA